MIRDATREISNSLFNTPNHGIHNPTPSVSVSDFQPLENKPEEQRSAMGSESDDIKKTGQDEVREQCNSLGGEESPSASTNISDGTHPPTAESTDAADKAANPLSKFFFENTNVKFTWASAYTAANIARTVESTLLVTHSADEEVLLVINIVRLAIGLLLQCYDTAEAVRNKEKLEKKENDSLDKLKKLREKDCAEISPENSVEATDSSLLAVKEKDNIAAPMQDKNTPSNEKTVEEKVQKVKNHFALLEAKSNVEDCSPAAKDARIVAGAVAAKETFFTVGAVIGLIQSAIKILKHFAPAIMAGSAAVGVAVAGVVMGALSVVFAVAANVIDIYQGFVKAREAYDEYSVFSNLKKEFESKIQAENNLNSLDSRFKDGCSNLFNKKIDSAKLNGGFAIGRIVRGFVGLAISAITAVGLVLSVGSAAPIAAAVGGGTAFVYFFSLIVRVARDVNQALAEVEECNAAEKWKEQYKDAEIFQKNSDDASTFDDDAGSNPYENKYFMIWMVAKQFEKDVIKNTNPDPARKEAMRALFASLGLSNDDIDMLELLPDSSDEVVRLVESAIRSKMKIADRKPEKKEVMQETVSIEQGMDIVALAP
ncbi:hypothetical protein KTQ42_02060|uniref:hypothetical protein n=1 Tax=Noviherbaspirillum sp. L7-7A TaxID=2850560 RepID=UPI001C2CB367|nr:hypothetical protein [Noviherbaspirillum sp. L7-7A]MBV0878087.1 hypothetical protein [Noviherbaspirillum sp. L7-7A]